MQPLYNTLDSFHLLDVKNPTHPSMFAQEATYDILIVALPYKDKELMIDSHAFIFNASTYYYFDKNSQTFVDFKTMQNVYALLNEKTNKTMKMVASIHESIDWMEEKLYANTNLSSFMRHWLGHKKDLARIHRLLSVAEETLEQFIESYIVEPEKLKNITNYSLLSL